MKEAGTVETIHIAPAAGERPQARETVEAVARRGLRGDRYFDGEGTFANWDGDERPAGYDITLIETEALNAIEREADIRLVPGEHRRNVATNGVALNHLVGRRFRVGGAVCRGDRLCEPCSHLQSLTEDGVLSALVHRGGLRTDVLEDGTIHVGDEIEPL